jgi:hypothetical protein
LDAGVTLAIVSIGTTEVGLELVQHLGVEDGIDFLYVDPTNQVYDALDLNRGVDVTFFNPATPWAFGSRLMQGKGIISEELKEVLAKCKDALYIPPKREQAFYQGGAFVSLESSAGSSTVYAHYDEATAAHAEPKEMVKTAIDAATKARA